MGMQAVATTQPFAGTRAAHCVTQGMPRHATIVPGELRHHLHNRFYHFNDTDVHEAAAFFQLSKWHTHKLIPFKSIIYSVFLERH